MFMIIVGFCFRLIIKQCRLTCSQSIDSIPAGWSGYFRRCFVFHLSRFKQFVQQGLVRTAPNLVAWRMKPAQVRGEMPSKTTRNDSFGIHSMPRQWHELDEWKTFTSLICLNFPWRNSKHWHFCFVKALIHVPDDKIAPLSITSFGCLFNKAFALLPSSARCRCSDTVVLIAHPLSG